MIFCFLITAKSSAQVYITRTGFVGFYSKTSMEDIAATNQQLLSVIDTEKKALAIMVLVKGFEFKKELMQTHFNENYAESDKFPKASFNGTYSGDVDIKNGAASTVNVKGSFTFHGVSKQIEFPATLQLANGILSGNATFDLTPEDYNVSIPLLVRNKIAKTLRVDVKVNCNPKT